MDSVQSVQEHSDYRQGQMQVMNEDENEKEDENKQIIFQMKRDQGVFQITNLNAFITKRKIDNICQVTFQGIKEQKINQGQKAKEFTPGGFSNRVQLNCDGGVFFIQKKCMEKRDSEKEREKIRIFSEEGITLPLIERNANDSSEDLLVEQVAGVMSLKNIYYNILKQKLHNQYAFLPFIKCIIVQLFDKLSKMHEKGYAHSDIKPDNIVMGFDRHFYFIDFGGVVEIDQNGSDNYLNYFTKQFNTRYYINKRPTQKKEIIACDNSQLSLSIIRLLVSDNEAIWFNEMGDSDFLELSSKLFSQLKNDSSNKEGLSRNMDLIRIIIFLFQFVFEPQNDLNQISKMIVDRINKDSDDNFYNFQDFQTNFLICKFECSFPLQEVMDIYSQIEEIEFQPKSNEIFIKSITLDNVRYIELLSELGYKIKCKDFLYIQYDSLQKYMKYKNEANKKLKGIQNEQFENVSQQFEVFDIYLEEKGVKIFGDFLNQSKRKEKYISLNQHLKLEKIDYHDYFYFILLQKLEIILDRKINSFYESMKTLKQKFQEEREKSFKNVFNSLIIQLPQRVELQNILINSNDLDYLRQLIDYNDNLQYLSLNLSQITSEQLFNQISSILSQFLSKKTQNLKLEEIQSYNQTFLNQVLLQKWTKLSFSLSKNIQKDHFNKIFSSSNMFQASELEIIFDQYKNQYLSEISSDLLNLCQNVNTLKLNFSRNTLQQKDYTFKQIFEQNKSAVNSKIEQLFIKLKRDESNQKNIDKTLIQYIQRQKRIKYFEFEVLNNQGKLSEQEIKNEMQQIKTKRDLPNNYFEFNINLNDKNNIKDIIINQQETEVKFDNLSQKIYQNQNSLLKIDLKNLKLTIYQLELITKQILQCQNLKTLAIQIIKIKKEDTILSLLELDKFQNQLQNLTKLKKLDFDLQKIRILKHCPNFIQIFLNINPQYLQTFSIQLKKKNQMKNIKTPFSIILIEKKEQKFFQAYYQVEPNFDEQDESFKKNQMKFFSFQSQFLRSKAVINISDSFQKNQIDLKYQIKYMFAYNFDKSIKKIRIIHNNLTYNIAMQIKNTLNNLIKEQKFNLDQQQKLILEFSSSEQQPIVEIFEDHKLLNLKCNLKFIINKFDERILIKLKKFEKNVKLVIKDLDLVDYQTLFKSMKKLFLNNQNCQVFLLFTSKDLLEKVLQIKEFSSIQNLIKFKVKDYSEQNYNDIQQQNSHSNSSSSQTEESSNNISDNRFISKDNNQVDQLEEQKELNEDKFYDKSDSQYSNSNQELKMMSKNSYTFVPYYQFSYENEQPLKISMNQSKFTIPYSFIFSQNYFLQTYFQFFFIKRLKRIDYLQTLSISKDVDIDEIVIDFENQNLDLQSAITFISLFQFIKGSIKKITLNFKNAHSEQLQESTQNNLKIIKDLISEMENLESLSIYLDNEQFDQPFDINSLKNLKHLKMQVNNDLTEQFKHQILDIVEEHPKLESYEIFTEGKRAYCFRSDDKINISFQQNIFYFQDIYFKGEMFEKFFDFFQKNILNINQNQNQIQIVFKNAEYVSYKFLMKIISFFNQKYLNSNLIVELRFESTIYIDPIVQFYQNSLKLNLKVKCEFKKEEIKRYFKKKIYY